jgi:hypothetical protein
MEYYKLYECNKRNKQYRIAWEVISRISIGRGELGG